MNSALFIDELAKKGVLLSVRLKVDAPSQCLTEEEKGLLVMWKQFLVLELLQKEMFAPPAEENHEKGMHPLQSTDSPKQPSPSSARVFMLDKKGALTRDPSDCYIWTREELGYGWWNASQFSPPPW